jgi:menaquinone-9 beta-reductase
VEHPHREGIVLIGDAASTCDPSWGQGLSLAVHDVRLLRDALLDTYDWNAVVNDYAAAHDRAFSTIHATEDWFTALFLETGPEADARRERALRLLAAEPERLADAFMSGPDAAPATEQARRRFFGEE